MKTGDERRVRLHRKILRALYGTRVRRTELCAMKVNEELMPCEDVSFYRGIYKCQFFPVRRRYAPGIPGRFAQHMHVA
jgi:hypothetical protein